jgi:N-acylneuraminate cytidylyltransferase
MSIIAVIPARGGSKRIHRKNIRGFCGKPIIAYSIEAAKRTNLFDRVIVSTDDEEIAEISRNLGADVPFIRPESLADDFTGTNSVTKHAIQWLQANEEDSIDFACCIYATAPFLTNENIAKGFDRLKKSTKSFVFTVTNYRFPIQRAIRINSRGEVEALYPENFYARSQDLEDVYHDAGQFYWGRAQAFLDDVVTFSEESLPFILPDYLVQDIDTEDDWKRAEYMYEILQKSNI